MSSFPGDPKPDNAFRGVSFEAQGHNFNCLTNCAQQSDTHDAQARIQQEIDESVLLDTSELHGHDEKPKVTLNLNPDMASPSRARRKAKEDAEHAALNALLEQGKSPDGNSFFSIIS